MTHVLGYVPPATVKKKVRKLGEHELLFFAIENKVREDLTPAGRRKLYAALKDRAPDVSAVRVGPLKVDLGDAWKELTKRFKELQVVRSGIVAGSVGDPVIKGTDISVYRVAALAETLKVAQILQDYPRLSEKKVERAIDYARAYPKLGRPYPTTSFKRATAILADSGVFDLPEDDEGGAES
jgi:uncharacterized protein (DUF433 family)